MKSRMRIVINVILYLYMFEIFLDTPFATTVSG